MYIYCENNNNSNDNNINIYIALNTGVSKRMLFQIKHIHKKKRKTEKVEEDIPTACSLHNHMRSWCAPL